MSCVNGMHFTKKWEGLNATKARIITKHIRDNSCLRGYFFKNYFAGAGVGMAGPAAGLAPFVKSISSISNCNTELPGIGP